MNTLQRGQALPLLSMISLGAWPLWVQAPAPFSNLCLIKHLGQPHLPQVILSRLKILTPTVKRSILVSAQPLDCILVDNALTFRRLQSPWSLGV
jgi:hypothetical protein